MSPRYCEDEPFVAIYRCRDSKRSNSSPSMTTTPIDTPIKNQHEDTIHVIPCVSAYVDGAQQFWGLYSLSMIFCIISGVLVRRRLDNAQQKVLKTLSKGGKR
jgi:hypothetical protein